jgi:ElaB/YqjD/DUF883 family membrane-anchored ribosome-binding protein
MRGRIGTGHSRIRNMNLDISDPVKQLHKALSELESLARSTAEKAGDGGADLVEQLKGTLEAARARIKEAEQSLQREAKQGAETANQYVHEHTWMSIGIAAAVAFLLGAMTARRD